MIRSEILGAGSFHPEQVWTNDDLAETLETSDEWIRQRTGIEQRYWVDGNDADASTSWLALKASEKAIERSGVQRSEIDMIILATLSPDHEFPGSACFLQARLGLPGVPALDVRQQCTGFIYGLSIADQFIKTGFAKRILLVGSEVHSKGLDKTNRGRDVAVLFGDGAGAVVVGAKEVKNPATDSMVWSTHLHADGRHAKELWVSAPGVGYVAPRLTNEIVAEGGQFPKMNGKSVFVNAVKKLPESIHEALQHNGLKIADIDLFVLHQANLRINEAVTQNMGISSEKVFNTIHKYGNTTAATIPIGLDEAVLAGKLKKGMLVCSAAFGSGFTWGSAIYRW